MKEITRIHLATLPYNIEVNAKKELEKYLQAIEQSLVADEDAMREIEARIAEIVSERGVVGEKVITIEDLKSIQQQLGDPKDFIDSETPVGSTGQTSVEKRIMRDDSKSVLGGVCAGISAYSGVDVVWIRLIVAILTIITSGAMILVYIIAWIVIPPAKTAAERLQMAGRPVTLEALQTESAVLAMQQQDHAITLTILRYIAAIGCVLVGVAALIAILAGVWEFAFRRGAFIESPNWLFLSITSFGGLLFTLLCGLWAYALFAAKFTKRIIISSAIIIALGLTSAVVGGGILYTGLRLPTNNEFFGQKIATKNIEVPNNLKDIKSLFVDSSSMVDINYFVTDDQPRVEMRYSENNSLATNLTVDGTNAKLQVKINSCQTTPFYCDMPINVNVYGPVLEALNVDGGTVRYNTSEPQKSLSIIEKSASSVFIDSDKQIQQLSLSLAAGSYFDGTNAIVQSVAMSLEGDANVELGTVVDVTASVPSSCARGRLASIKIEYSTTTRVNGADLKSDTVLPCVVIESQTSQPKPSVNNY